MEPTHGVSDGDPNRQWEFQPYRRHEFATMDATTEALDRVLDTKTWDDDMDALDQEDDDKHEKENPDDYFQVPNCPKNTSKDAEFTRRINLFGGLLREILERIDKPIRLMKRWDDALAITAVTPFDRVKHFCVWKAVQTCMYMFQTKRPNTKFASWYIWNYWMHHRPFNEPFWISPNVTTWDQLEALITEKLPCMNYLNSKMFDLLFMLELTQFWNHSDANGCAFAVRAMMHEDRLPTPNEIAQDQGVPWEWIRWPRFMYLVTDPEVLRYVVESGLLDIPDEDTFGRQRILAFLIQHPQALQREDIIEILKPTVEDLNYLFHTPTIQICFHLPPKLVEEWLRQKDDLGLWGVVVRLLADAASQPTADAARPAVSKASEIWHRCAKVASVSPGFNMEEMFNGIRRHTQRNPLEWFDALLTEYFSKFATTQ